MNRAFSLVERCAASPTGWVEISDDGPDDLDVEKFTSAELLAHPDVRVLSANEAAEAERVDREEC